MQEGAVVLGHARTMPWSLRVHSSPAHRVSSAHFILYFDTIACSRPMRIFPNIPHCRPLHMTGHHYPAPHSPPHPHIPSQDFVCPHIAANSLEIAWFPPLFVLQKPGSWDFEKLLSRIYIVLCQFPSRLVCTGACIYMLTNCVLFKYGWKLTSRCIACLKNDTLLHYNDSLWEAGQRQNRYMFDYICAKSMNWVKLDFKIWLYHPNIVLEGPGLLVLAHQWCPGHPPRILHHLQIRPEWSVGMRIM